MTPGPQRSAVDLTAGRLAIAGSVLGVVVGVVDAAVGSSIRDWVGNKLDTTTLGLATVALSAIGVAAAIAWQPIDASSFTSFDSPGYAKIAASLSRRPYGDGRTLLSYEARTRATDETARGAFLRYWTFVSPGVGFVMRSLLALIAREARRSG